MITVEAKVASPQVVCALDLTFSDPIFWSNKDQITPGTSVLGNPILAIPPAFLNFHFLYPLFSDDPQTIPLRRLILAYFLDDIPPLSTYRVPNYLGGMIFLSLRFGGAWPGFVGLPVA